MFKTPHLIPHFPPSFSLGKPTRQATQMEARRLLLEVAFGILNAHPKSHANEKREPTGGQGIKLNSRKDGAIKKFLIVVCRV